MLARLLQPFLFGVTALGIGSLLVYYNRLLRSVESAATAAGLIDRA